MREIKRQFLKLIRFATSKYSIIIFTCLAFLLMIYTSYAYIRTTLDWRITSQIAFSNLSYSMTIDGTSTTTITSEANSGTVFYNVIITNLSEINTRYYLMYNNTNVSVKASNLSLNNATGVIGPYRGGSGADRTRTIRIAVTNTTASAQTITFLVAGGYTWNSESSIKLNNGYTKIDTIYEETGYQSGKTLAEQVNAKLNCTPTSTVPCLYKENATVNYLNYGGKTWRIMGSYLISGEYVTKLILNEPLETGVQYSNVTSGLASFYETLTDTSLIRTSSPFVCTGTSTISCTGNANIGLISKSEYDLIDKENSYLYAKTNKEYWTNTANGSNMYVAGNRGIKAITSTELALIRPSIYLIGNTCNRGTGSERTPYQLAVCHNLTADLNYGSMPNGINYTGKYGQGFTYTIPTPIRNDFTLRSWSSNVASTTLVGTTLTMGTEDTTLTANWVPNHTLTIDANGGIWTGTSPQSVGEGLTSIIVNPVKPGWKFTGWAVSGTGSTMNETTFTMGTENTTLTANWEIGVMNYTYLNSDPYYTYEVPEDGYYKLEVWGAQGGDANSTYIGGYGGYSTGEVYLNESDNIYLYVGEEGSSCAGDSPTTCVASGGTNNGGSSNAAWTSATGATRARGSGGAASYIVTEPGTISSFQSDLNKIFLIGSGGSGGTYFIASSSYAYCTGGSGGGNTGVLSTCTSSLMSYSTSKRVATQSSAGQSVYAGDTSEGAFGMGGNGYSGGGGGYWGGSGGYLYSNSGSGYIGNSNLTNKSMYCYKCAESTNVNTFTVNTMGTSTLRDTTNCPNGYNDNAISKCAKAGNGHIRITYVGDR